MNTSTSTVCSCATSAPPTSNPYNISIKMGILKVRWTDTCKGTVELVPHFSVNKSSLPVCQSSEEQVSEILQNVCKDRKGCEYESRWLHTGTEAKDCYTIHANGASPTSGCKTIRVKCKGWCRQHSAHYNPKSFTPLHLVTFGEKYTFRRSVFTTLYFFLLWSAAALTGVKFPDFFTHRMKNKQNSSDTDTHLQFLSFYFVLFFCLKKLIWKKLSLP